MYSIPTIFSKIGSFDSVMIATDLMRSLSGKKNESGHPDLQEMEDTNSKFYPIIRR